MFIIYFVCLPALGKVRAGFSLSLFGSFLTLIYKKQEQIYSFFTNVLEMTTKKNVTLIPKAC